MGTVGFTFLKVECLKNLHGVGAMGPGFDYIPASGTTGAFKQVMMLMVIETFNITHQLNASIRITNQTWLRARYE